MSHNIKAIRISWANPDHATCHLVQSIYLYYRMLCRLWSKLLERNVRCLLVIKIQCAAGLSNQTLLDTSTTWTTSKSTYSVRGSSGCHRYQYMKSHSESASNLILDKDSGIPISSSLSCHKTAKAIGDQFSRIQCLTRSFSITRMFQAPTLLYCLSAMWCWFLPVINLFASVPPVTIFQEAFPGETLISLAQFLLTKLL